MFYISTFQLCTEVRIKCLIFVIRKKRQEKKKLLTMKTTIIVVIHYTIILVNKLFNILVKLAKYWRKTFEKKLLSLTILRWSFVVQLFMHSRLFLYLSLLCRSILINNPYLYHWYLVFVRTQEKVEKVLDSLITKELLGSWVCRFMRQKYFFCTSLISPSVKKLFFCSFYY